REFEIRNSKLEANPNQSDSENSAFRTRHSAFFKVLALLFFAFGLLSKPMVVTLPFVLLLLDIWPLQRFQIFEHSSLCSNLARLLREKITFFILAFAASIVTYAVQKNGGAVTSVADFSIARRIANSLLAYAEYLSKTFWPVNLSAVYPMPLQLRVAQILLAASLLAGLTIFFAYAARQKPFVLTGWLWFLGMLVTVIGLVQAVAE